MNELISVIVPIYNVEKYLNKCVDSLLNQTYKKLEIILVNDGSPDNCGKICDDYEKKDNRIKVIHKKNGGLSDARNVGLKNANGKYVCFIDSDDYVTEDYIEYLYNLVKTTKAEIGIVMEQKFFEQPRIYNKREKIKLYTNKEALEIMLYQKEFSNGATSKIFLKKIVEDIDFPVNEIYEDLGTVYKFFLKADRIAYSNLEKYYYLQRDNSIMRAKFKEKDFDYIRQAEKLMKDVSCLNDKKINNAAISRYISANFSILLKINKEKKYYKYRKEIMNNIKKYRLGVLLNYKVRLKNKAALLLSYLGVI